MVTNSTISIAAARIKQVATERFQRKEAQSTSGYKIMEIVGRFAAENHWDASFALTCYRAAIDLDDYLNPEETDILDELYSRITSTRDHDTQLSDVMAFWAKLQTYREHEVWPAQSIKERYNDFLWYEVWPELTNAQQHGRNKLEKLCRNDRPQKSGVEVCGKSYLTNRSTKTSAFPCKC